MHYKGYIGSVEFSEEDACLYGKVLGIRALISYEGESVSVLREDFQASVDDYLEACAEKDVEPEKPYKGSFNVRVSPETHREAAMCAARQGTTLNSFIVAAVEKAVRAAQIGK